MICMDIRVKVHPRHLLEFIQVASTILKDGKKEDGCTAYLLHRDMEDSYLFNFETRWESTAGLDVHIGSQGFGALLGALLFLTDTYEIAISEMSTIEDGNEYIREIRNQNKTS